MKKVLFLALLASTSLLYADEITFTGVNFAGSTFSASAAGLSFGNVVNVLVTDNTTGKSIMLLSVQSGSTGTATDFVPGPPLIADYNGAGANSVLVMTGGHTYLSGAMEDSGRLEAEWPNRAGAFLSRFNVSFVDPAVLTELGTSTRFAPEGSVSLTLGETAFDGTTLHATLGGSQITIETQAVTVVPEVRSLFLYGTGILVCLLPLRRITRQHF